jgi:post-segregation antitoxin (ccd killing protein)
MKLNTRGWKKISQDENKATFKDSKGNTLSIAHKTLSPRLKAELDSLPVHMAEGGEVKKPSKGPAIVKKSAEEVQKGATSSGFLGIDKYVDNFKKGLQKPKSYKDGGVVGEDGKDLTDEEISSALQSKPIDTQESIVADAMAAPVRPEYEALLKQAQQDLPEGTRAFNSPEQLALSRMKEIDALKSDPGSMSNWSATSAAQNLKSIQQPQVDVPVASAMDPAVGAPTAVSAQPAAPQQGLAEAVATAVGGPGTKPATGDPMLSALMGQNDAYEMKKRGLEAEAAAIAKQGQEEAVAQGKKQAVLQDIQNQYGQQLTDIDNNIKATVADIQNGQIDPGRVWNSKSTEGKIGTILGILGAGLGAGMSGQENMALAMLNKEIDRDIDAQKANLHNKSNSLNAMISQAGSLRGGMEMMKSLKLGMVAADLDKAAALAKSPIAKAKLMQAKSEVLMQQQQNNARLAGQMTLNRLMKSVQADPTQTGAVVEAAESINPEKGKDLREREVPGVGFANTSKDATDLKEMRSGVMEAKSGLAKLKSLMNKPGRSLSLADREEAKTLQQTLVGALRLPITGPGAMNEGERKMLEDIIANPTKVFSLDSSTKRRLDTLTTTLDDKFAAAARARGIQVSDSQEANAKHSSELEKKARERLKANPNDPAAKAYLQKLGK